ncbi:RidA family protein [Blastopirellula sp. J2-11]|uniref:RidA family protein n=1 Tax=Blastopirellula sp. J2-11 TaxID=2943192 RepID=UPI0021C90D96|nr:RidA family protein [Blastopirellula sp. J2-11]UUO05485.1 RidA family protein [Blastopirellula sp. J2-11]
MSADAKITELKLELPPAPKAMGVYKPVLVHNGLAYISGHGPLQMDGTLSAGKVGQSVDQQAGYDAARQTGLAMLSTLQAHLGSLDKVKRLVKTFGMVNAVDDFTAHPAVINGFSELMAEVFGPDNGIAARSAIGVSGLPGGMIVEVEAIFEVEA